MAPNLDPRIPHFVRASSVSTDICVSEGGGVRGGEGGKNNEKCMVDAENIFLCWCL